MKELPPSYNRRVMHWLKTDFNIFRIFLKFRMPTKHLRQHLCNNFIFRKIKKKNKRDGSCSLRATRDNFKLQIDMSFIHSEIWNLAKSRTYNKKGGARVMNFTFLPIFEVGFWMFIFTKSLWYLKISCSGLGAVWCSYNGIRNSECRFLSRFVYKLLAPGTNSLFKLITQVFLCMYMMYGLLVCAYIS